MEEKDIEQARQRQHLSFKQEGVKVFLMLHNFKEKSVMGKGMTKQ